MSDGARRTGPFVVAAAIRVGEHVWTLPPPARHCHLIRAWCDAHWKDGEPARIGWHEQGFMVSTGAFVDRAIAAELAYLAGQIDRRKRGLFSEDLW